MTNEGYRNAYQQGYSDAMRDFRKEPKTGHCKDCKYFEYDSVVKVD